MSVLMILRVAGDPKAWEAADQAAIKAVAERGAAAGGIRHRFFTNGSEILVVDEWPDAESFQSFFASSPEIPELMASAGITAEPTVEFWERMNIDDAINWD